MAYIGNQPAESFTSFATQEFSTSATTSYTLDHAVTNENEIALFVNNVRQQPGSGKAYTATGTALTLSAATASTDTMYCVFLGRALQTVTPATNSITAAMISDDTVTKAKLADQIDIFSGTSLNAADLGAGLHIKTGDSGVTSPNTSSDELIIEGSGTAGLAILTGSGGNGAIDFGDSADNNIGRIIYNHTDNAMQFHGNASERMRLDSSGRALIGTTDTSLYNNSSGTGWFVLDGNMQVATNGNAIGDFNRMTSDGNLINFYQAGNSEGHISVSGSTVSYGSFTGTHWTRLADNSKPTILKGTVLETLDEMCDWYNLEFDITDEKGNTNTKKIPHVLTDTQSVGDKVTYNHNGKDYEATIVKEADIKHMKSKVSDTTDAKNVYGVFYGWDEDGEGYNDFWVASVGSYVVRIKQGETIAKGDLLQSNGDGTAKVQSDDNIKSSSFAKVLSTTVIETYDDGSFIVPCSLMC
jgi:hypothetical protein